VDDGLCQFLGQREGSAATLAALAKAALNEPLPDLLLLSELKQLAGVVFSSRFAGICLFL